MTLTLAQVDAFTERAFAGNPAAFCILDGSVDDSWMQNLAMEMNLAETAFLKKTAGGYNLRWMTPKVEVKLCGHATLASAHILWQLEHVDHSQEIYFFTKSGTLIARKAQEWIELDFPAQPAKAIETDAIGQASFLQQALGIKIDYVGKNEVDILVETDSEESVRAMSPDLSALEKLPARGVIVTAPAGAGAASASVEYDFVSRFFAPGVGIDEDPVTGSAHCCLAPYWSKKLNKSELIGYQASQRGGMVRVRIVGDRVILSGQAATIFVGQLAPSAMPTVVASS